MLRRIGVLLVATTVVIGTGAGVSAQRPPTIAAAANLNFALTEIAKQFKRDRGHAGRAGVRRVGHADAADPGRRAVRDVPGGRRGVPESADRGRSDARCRRRVRRRPAGDLRAQRIAAHGRRTARRAGSRWSRAGKAGRFAIANPDVAPYGRAAEAVLRKRGLVGRASPAAGARRHASRRPRSSRRPETPSAA